MCQDIFNHTAIEMRTRFSRIFFGVSGVNAIPSGPKDLSDKYEALAPSSVAEPEEFSIVPGLYMTPYGPSLVQKNRRAIHPYIDSIMMASI
jgi:hypothetical protein